jgi:ribokinase
MHHSHPSPRVAVIGSSNVDLVMKMDRLPVRGETVTDAVFMQTFGGKGANQAVACARAGASTLFVNAVGDDPYVAAMLEGFAASGIDCSAILRIPGCNSGHALCMIGERGSNYLSVAPGANHCITPELLAPMVDRLRAIPIWMLQCEIPVETNRFLLEEVKTPANRVLWNYAPYVEFVDRPLHACDVLIVNEIEATQLSGVEVRDAGSALESAEALRRQGVKEVVVTLGAEGSLYVAEGINIQQPVFELPVVDTVAAGDTFCGALACALSEGVPIRQALRFATAAASIAVTRLGAQPSIPVRAEIEGLLKSR